MKKIKMKGNKKGLALVTAVVVLAVMFVLGIAILGMSSNEAKLTGRQFNRTQAYYSARSGAEIALARMDEQLSTVPFYEVSELFAALSDFSGSVVSGKDNYAVEFIDGGLVLEDKLKIFSTGTVNNVAVTTAVTMDFMAPNFDLTGWVNKGKIILGAVNERVEAPVVVKMIAKDADKGHAYKKEAGNIDTRWIAPAIHFIETQPVFSLEVTGKTLIFETTLLSFEKAVYIKAIDENGFGLDNFNGKGFLGPDNLPMKYDADNEIKSGWSVLYIKEGIREGNNTNNTTVVLNPGFYAYSPDTDLSNQTHRESPDHIQAITNLTTQAYILKVIRDNSSLHVNRNNMIWSEE